MAQVSSNHQAVSGNSADAEGGQLTQRPGLGLNGHNCADAGDGLKHLQAHVSTAAFDSAQDVDAPKCHPNTRKAVLDEIMGWIIIQKALRIQWILWLNGAAGAGKSSIARSIVELCLAQNIPIAGFFFFRSDPMRNTIEPVVATLVHQLIHAIPELRSIIVPRIEHDSLIFAKSLETQLKTLIFDPLRIWTCELPSTDSSTVLLLFDGIDECEGDDNQVNLIRLISNLVRSQDFPVIVFFGSRPENQLKGAFSARDISSILLQLPLDNHYLPNEDIQLFMDDKFTEIKETHPFRHLCDPEWPTPALVEEIVAKSSGQFIYASVTMKFVSSPKFHPAQQLEIIRGIRPPGSLTPFAQLDALYQHIFSRVQNMERVAMILAYVWLDNHYEADCSKNLGIPKEEICILFSDLTSVISCNANGAISFLHASLTDFLFDQSRSKQYYIDIAAWRTNFTILFLDNLKLSGPCINIYSLIENFLSRANASPELQKCIRECPVEKFNCGKQTIPLYTRALRELDFGDGGKTYRHQLKLITHHYLSSAEYFNIGDLTKEHDLAPILVPVARAYLQDIFHTENLALTLNSKPNTLRILASFWNNGLGKFLLTAFKESQDERDTELARVFQEKWEVREQEWEVRAVALKESQDGRETELARKFQERWETREREWEARAIAAGVGGIMFILMFHLLTAYF